MQDYVEKDCQICFLFPCWFHAIVEITIGPGPANRAIQVTLFGLILSLK